MSEPEMKDTQPTGALGGNQPNDVPGDTQPNSIKPETPLGSQGKKFPTWLVVLCVVTVIAIGVLGGYGSGMGQRFAAQKTQVVGQLDEQFQLGQQAFEAGNYELAKQYFEFIITTDSNFPGIQVAYTDLLLRMQVTITPVFSPTPVVSPTPDLRGAEEIYNSALQLLNSNDWTGAITNLDSLRRLNPAYRTAEVDGMYYMALRQRGIEKMTTACQNVNLEGGIYDLTLAEHFVGEGNLDAYADSLRTYARLYIIGASFWDQDWFQAQSFFAQVMIGYPNLSDSSCMSATKRWMEASTKIADQELASGNPCYAEETYAYLFSSVNDPAIATAYPAATAAANKCNGDGGGGGTVENNPPPVENPTETPSLGAPACDPLLGTPCP
jgi:hypothetical protein